MVVSERSNESPLDWATTLRRGLPGSTAVLRADYAYYANGLVASVVYSPAESAGAAVTFYKYDDVRRLTAIDHQTTWRQMPVLACQSSSRVR